MTPQQLHGTHLLSNLLVLMLKDARSNDPTTADDAREWLNAAPLEGMASLQRTCEQLAAAEQSAIHALSVPLVGRTDSDWLTAIRDAQHDNVHAVHRLEMKVIKLLQCCDQLHLDAPSAGTDHAISAVSPPEDNDPSPANNSPAL